MDRNGYLGSLNFNGVVRCGDGSRSGGGVA